MVFYGKEDWTMVKIETIGRSRMMATQDREKRKGNVRARSPGHKMTCRMPNTGGSSC
jgi:hypothetical protein